jgi:predicted DNA-binding transcriptional regulator AlpA
MHQVTNGAAQRLLQLPQVLALAKVSSRTLDRLEQAGLFPKRRKLGKQVLGWPEHAVLEAVGAPADPPGVPGIPASVIAAARGVSDAKRAYTDALEEYQRIVSDIQGAKDAIAAPSAYAAELQRLREHHSTAPKFASALIPRRRLPRSRTRRRRSSRASATSPRRSNASTARTPASSRTRSATTRTCRVRLSS